MADGPSGGRWLLMQEMFERGDPAFVDELRTFHDAPTLADFADRWYADPRPASRQLLLDYLDRPLNAFRHEPLVKRLFKRAEAAGDDPVMARFLVLFDRSIRRVRRRRDHYQSQELRDRAEAQKLAELWRARGFDDVIVWEDWRGRSEVTGRWSEEFLTIPFNTSMPRGTTNRRNPRTGDGMVDLIYKRIGLPRLYREGVPISPSIRAKLERLRLFSVATRQYLRRRSWRYFRRLGRRQPERYVAAVSEALLRYQDLDVADGLALIDNWGLVHILFHSSPALVARPEGWVPAEGHLLAELAPAPIYGRLWEAAPRAVVDLMVRGRCRPVRQWAIQLVRRDPAARATLSLEERLGLLAHEDAEVVALAAELLRDAEELEAVDPDRWLALVEMTNPTVLEVICELMGRHLRPERLTLEQVARLAASRPLPLARLGLEWLRTKTPRGDAECRALLGLVEAEAEPIRPELVHWARGVLSGAPEFRPEWVLEYLDSRFADVRAEGLAWLRDEPRARDDVTIWGRLLESPYDDIRLALVAELEARVAGRDPARARPLDLDPDALRLLWASVLLNIHRGGRAKPVVVRQLLRRLERRPEELPRLLPLLAVALRSVRGPEWRAGLAAVVQLVERHADAAPLVRAAFPELKWA